MQETVEFYQGWMVELVETVDGFRSYYRSPFGESFSDRFIYSTPASALQEAFHLINYFGACQALRRVLREAFEVDAISFAEWKKLRQSLDDTSREQFIRSPF